MVEKHAELMPSGDLMGETKKESTVDGDQSKNRHDLSELYEYYLNVRFRCFYLLSVLKTLLLRSIYSLIAYVIA